jgi:SAM-dependent methyltransferase
MQTTDALHSGATSPAERLLLSLSRSEGAPDYAGEGFAHQLDTALALLVAAFPNFLELIDGRDILDFGCGQGYQAVAMCLQGARRVVGTDVRNSVLEHGRKLAAGAQVANRVTFADRIAPEDEGRFDIVVSLNSMEHFTDPGVALDLMARALKPGGSLLLTFSPPWYAPYGSHMHFFTRVPWVHLVFGEQTVMNVRRHFRGDGATRYEEVEGGLNRMSRRKFGELIRATPLRVRSTRYDAVKGIPLVTSIPFVNELFTNRISCILEKPQ